MAVTITSYTPTTGPASGGTECTVTGTGLLTVEAVLVGANEAVIEAGTTDTTLKFRTPEGAVGNANVALYDGTTVVEAATPFAYTAAPTSETLVNTLAGAIRLDINTGSYDAPTWVEVKGNLGVKYAVAYTTEDDSDTDSGDWGSDFIPQRKWSLVFDVKRGRGSVTKSYDPGQQALLAASKTLDPVDVRWYDRTAVAVTDEAQRGYGLVQWAPAGGNKTANKVSVTITGQGAPSDIDNPVIADPTLAGPYAS